MALSGSMHVCYFSMHKLFYDTGGQHSICATISYLYQRNGVRGQLSYRTSYAKHTLHMHHRNRKISSVKCMVARYQLLFTGVCSKAPRCPSSISSCCLYLEIQIFPFSRESLGRLPSVMKFPHPSIRAGPPPPFQPVPTVTQLMSCYVPRSVLTVTQLMSCYVCVIF